MQDSDTETVSFNPVLMGMSWGKSVKFFTAGTGVRRDNIDERGPYYGGDMVLHEDQLEDFKAGILGSTYRWPGGKVPYVLDPYFSKPWCLIN